MANFPVQAKVALTKSYAAVQKVKSDPTPKTYNDFVGGSGEGGSSRNLSQQFGNVIKLMGLPNCPQDLLLAMNGLDAFDAELKAFGNGAKHEIDKNATPVAVVTLVREFSTLVKGVEPYYHKMVKYLNENPI